MRKIVVTFGDGTSKRYVNEEYAQKAIEKAGNGKMEIVETNEIKVEFGKKSQDWVLLVEEGETKLRFEAETTEEARLIFNKYRELGFKPKGGTAQIALTATKEELLVMAESFVPKKHKQSEYNKTWNEKNKEHSRYLKDRTSARSFIRNKATLSDVEELRGLLDEREEQLKKSGQ